MSSKVVTLDVFRENHVQKTLSRRVQMSAHPDKHPSQSIVNGWPICPMDGHDNG